MSAPTLSSPQGRHGANRAGRSTTTTQPGWRQTINRLFARVVGDNRVDEQHGVAYGPLSRHQLDVYRPSARDALQRRHVPPILFLYGGTWSSGHRSIYGFVGRALARHGLTVAVADYRLWPDVQYPDFMNDAALAYAWLGQNAVSDDVSGDPRTPAQHPTSPRVDGAIMMGHSAGAHMAALLAARSETFLGADVPPPAAIIGLGGPYAMYPTKYEGTAHIFASAETTDAPRPIAHLGPHMPPALLLHGADDTLIDAWIIDDFVAALERNGTPFQFERLAGVGHVGLVLSIARLLRWRTPTLNHILAFIDATFPSPPNK